MSHTGRVGTDYCDYDEPVTYREVVAYILVRSNLNDMITNKNNEGGNKK